MLDKLQPTTWDDVSCATQWDGDQWDDAKWDDATWDEQAKGMMLNGMNGLRG